MNMRDLLVILAAAAGVIHIASWILLMAALERRGYKTNFFLARLFIYRYLRVYRTKTREETGRTGPLYPLWLISIMAMAVFVLTILLAY